MLTRVSHPWEHCAHQDSFQLMGFGRLPCKFMALFYRLILGEDWCAGQVLTYRNSDGALWICTGPKPAAHERKLWTYIKYFIVQSSYREYCLLNANVFMWGCICKLGKAQGTIHLTLLPLSRFWLQVLLLSFWKTSQNKLGWCYPPRWEAAVGVVHCSGKCTDCTHPCNYTGIRGREWLPQQAKGMWLGFGWICSNNSLSREGDGFPPRYSPWLRVCAGALLLSVLSVSRVAKHPDRHRSHLSSLPRQS